MSEGVSLFFSSVPLVPHQASETILVCYYDTTSEWITSYLFITASPTIRLFIVLSRSNGPKAVLSILVNKTPTLFAAVVLNFIWCEEKGVLSVRWQV